MRRANLHLVLSDVTCYITPPINLMSIFYWFIQFVVVWTRFDAHCVKMLNSAADASVQLFKFHFLIIVSWTSHQNVDLSIQRRCSKLRESVEFLKRLPQATSCDYSLKTWTCFQFRGFYFKRPAVTSYHRSLFSLYSWERSLIQHAPPLPDFFEQWRINLHFAACDAMRAAWCSFLTSIF